MDTAKQKLTNNVIARPSILKTYPKKVFKGGYNIVQSRNASLAEARVRKDFYGNCIDKQKKHTIFLNMSENKVAVVENWKELNHSSNSEKLNKVKCTIF